VIIFFLKSFWSTIEANWAISSVECLKVSSKRRVSSSKTPILVEVEPGFMIKLLIAIIVISFNMVNLM
jgi:hypothetical protein